MNGIESRDVTVPATDDYQLAGTIYRPEATSKGAIVITSAMAVARSFYQPFARWFADRGFSVLTFDYRGIGNSAPEDLRGFQGTVADWALKDIQGAINWMKEFTPDGPLYVIAHSIGGQIMGLLGDNVEIDGLVTVSAQSGYWRLQYPGQRWKLFIASYVVFPTVTNLFGYLPWSKVFGGEDIPKTAARQWYRWCRHPDYILGDESLNGRERYDRFSAPILAYSFEDDIWGYRKAVDRMMSEYSGARLHRVHLDPEQVGVESIGHFGFFKPRLEDLWPDLLSRMTSRFN